MPKHQHYERGVDGKPKIVNGDGTIYVGEWKNYFPHGKGKMYFSDGSYYTGFFSEGAPQGEGRLIN